MFSERLLTIYEKMAAGGAVGVGRGLLCSVAAEVTGSDAASIVLVADDAAMRPFCASDDFARSLVDLEMTVGEGPHHLAHANDAMVNVSDLEKVRTTDWMLYLPSSLALGARAVVGVPVRIGVIRFGVLCLFRREPGEMSEDQLTDAFLMASVVGRGIVALQADVRLQCFPDVGRRLRARRRTPAAFRRGRSGMDRGGPMKRIADYRMFPVERCGPQGNADSSVVWRAGGWS